MTGNTGSVTYVTTVTSADLDVSGTGVVTSPGTTPPGSYTVSGTDSDASSDSGTWTFTLNVNIPDSVPVGSNSQAVAITPDGSFAYVANLTSGTSA